MVLIVCSEYFEEIFERTKCNHPFIVIKDIQPSEIEALLNYMYKGEVNVLQELLPGLIKAAEALKIKGLAVPDDNFNSVENPEPVKDKKRTMQPNSSPEPKRIKQAEKEESKTTVKTTKSFIDNNANNAKEFEETNEIAEQENDIDNHSNNDLGEDPSLNDKDMDIVSIMF